MTRPTYIALAVSTLLALASCAGGGAATATDSATDPDPASATDPATATATDPASATDPATATDPASAADSATPWTWSAVSVPIGPTACCLSLSEGRLVWAEEGDIWMHDLRTGQSWTVVADPALQTDPVLFGDTLIWADARSGDLDLWTLKVSVGLALPLVQAPGDQRSPSLWRGLLAWVDHRKPPHGPREAEIWTWDLAEAGASPEARTDDDSEQLHPHVQGRRVVWTDFSRDPDRRYLPGAPVAENNGDIVGWDAATRSPFEITRDPAKQMRPAIFEDRVVWLDWRGVDPEPKFAAFSLYTRRVGGGAERKIAASSWLDPDLQIRPGLSAHTAAWIGVLPEPRGEIGAGARALLLAGLEGQDLPLGLPVAAGNFQGLDLREGALGWYGEGRVFVRPLDAITGKPAP